MKRALLAISLCLFFTSCHRTTRQMWEDTKTAGRYMNKGISSFFGRHDPNRARSLGSRPVPASSFSQTSPNNDFIPLADDERYSAASAQNYPPSRESPGDPGSAIPGIDNFNEPQGRLAELFRKIQFETDSYSVRGEENLNVLATIASYMMQNKGTYVFVEGHADERGSASYNLALASRRSNAVRDFLIDQGVNPDQLFTISYGKERPLAMGHDEIAWSQNRRAAFKLYER